MMRTIDHDESLKVLWVIEETLEACRYVNNMYIGFCNGDDTASHRSYVLNKACW